MRYTKIILLPFLITLSIIAACMINGTSTQNLLPYKTGETYPKEWAEVDTLLAQGLPKDALTIVESLRQRAMGSSNYSQIVKTLLYRQTLAHQDEEESTEKVIAETESELTKMPFPAKPVVQSILADMYWNYYEQNRYKILQRTVTSDFKQDDIATWDAKKFADKVSGLYFASLQSVDSLQRTDIKVFEDVLVKAPGSRNYRPTLYDFLAWKAINFFSNSESGVTEAANHFKMEDARYLALANDFLKIPLTDNDSTSFKLKGLKVMQQLTRFQINSGSTTSLVDLEVKRLQFAHNNITLEEKDSLYMQALKQLEKNHIKDSVSAMVGLEIARELEAEASKYNALEAPQYLMRRKEAVDKCKEVAARFPKTSWATGCDALVQTILEKTLSVQAEKVNVPNAPFRALVTFSNTDSIYLRVVDATNFDKKDTYNADTLLDELLAQQTVTSWKQVMPISNDYRQHNTEVKIPALKKGAYYLLISNSPQFNHDSGSVAYCRVNISNIGFMQRNIPLGTEYLVHDLTSGQPLKGATVEVFSRKYNYQSRSYTKSKAGDYKTDVNGKFTFKGKTNDERYVQLAIHYKDDLLNTQDFSNSYPYASEKQEKKWNDKTFFFLDRAIYRPGQTVFFKGLVISTDGDNNSIQKNTKQTIELVNVNNQIVSTLKLTTNDYGTYSGTFTLPSSALNGEMTIRTGGENGDNSSSVMFHVEDYKRPHFEVTFDPITGSFKLGEQVTVKGKASNYSGTPVDGSNVVYRVTRRTYYPYWGWDFWWKPAPRNPDMEIANGVTKTDATGAFTIGFTAIGDSKIDVKNLPEYSYEVTADVTDQSNETQSTNTTVSVGVVALRADMDLKEGYNTTDTNSIAISTTNLNNQFEAAKGTVTIHRLVDPGLLLRDRKWEVPDQYTMTEREFRKDFPNDTYRNEGRYQTWAKGDKVLDINFNTETSRQFKLGNLANWKQGQYVAELLTQDHFGKAVKVVKYFTVYDMAKKDMPFTTLNLYKPIIVTAEPGEKASILLGSSAKNVRVLYEVVLKGEVIHSEWISLNNEKKIIELPIEERFRGNVQMNFTFATHGKVFAETLNISVPYSNKDLKVEFATFRDKLLPGSQEEWKVKITGPKGEKVAAEMLTSMYDASLDIFATNNWVLDIYQYRYGNDNGWGNWAAGNSYNLVSGNSISQQWKYRITDYFQQDYDILNRFINPFVGYVNYGGNGIYTYNWGTRRRDDVSIQTIKSKAAVQEGMDQKNADDIAAVPGVQANMGTYTIVQDENRNTTSPKQETKPAAPPRTNFNETAFFYPQLQTDSSGNIIFSFKVPDALTRWKFMALAHTQDLKYGLLTKEAVAQKDLMITTNAPRFLREGDEIELTAKVNSLSDKDLSGTAELTLIDPYTNQPINSLFGPETSGKTFSVKKGQSISIAWKLQIPQGVSAVTYRITAKSGDFSDGEESSLSILPNRTLVTESMPISIKGGQEKTFTLDKLLTSGNSKTLTNHRLTLEITSNPAWYAVQALPYLMEYPYECSEQLFNRYYANSLATHIAGSNPRIKQVFDSWKSSGGSLSNLEKNQDLKNLMLEETPWVMQAKNETERKNRLALLFDINKMSTEQANALNKLKDNQSPNGGWPWFKGMPDNRYITQYVITGLGRLQHMGVSNYQKNLEVKAMVTTGLRYLDSRIEEDYKQLLKDKADLTKQQISDIQVQYLYARTFYKDLPVAASTKAGYDFYLQQAKKYWLGQSKYAQAMVALVLNANDDAVGAKAILKSLSQTAIRNEELGMYWKDNTAGYYWYQAPIETQAMMIEAFSEIGKDQSVVDDLRTWLLKQKQVQDWKTTKATSDACYALLLNGNDWLTATEIPSIMVGTEKVEAGKNVPKAEAGTGYLRTTWDANDVKPNMGKVTIKKTDKGIAWGALYWQYFEQLDKISPAKTPLQLNKKLFLQQNTANGPVLKPITDNTVLKAGDLVKVRIELRSDRDMDFVQMKDMRASGFEPIDVLSGYQYQGGLGYYQSPRDAATNFFFDKLRKGTYVFEYSLRVSQKGNFSNGITTIQCMYAPEFGAHSEGIRVKVE